MVAVKKLRDKLSLVERGNSLFEFCFSHPYITAFFACLCCLFVRQNYLSGWKGDEAVTEGIIHMPTVGVSLAVYTAFAVVGCIICGKIRKTTPSEGLSVNGVFGTALFVLLLSLFSVSYISLYGAAALCALLLLIRYRSIKPIKRIFTFLAVMGTAAVINLISVKADNMASGAVLCGLALAFGGIAVSALTRGVKTEHLVGAVFILGFALRLGYVLDVQLPENQHDVFPLSYNDAYPRHNSYIWHIYNNWSLPTEGVYNAGLSQYYHPPLHHALSALWMRFQILFGIDAFAAYENIQYLTLFYSAAMMVAADKLFCEFKLKGALRVALTALIAFHPTFYILAGSINNDSLCVLFTFLAVLYTVRWYKNPSVVNTVGLALSIGSAMLAKLSGAVVAIGTAYVMLAKLLDYRTGIKDNFKRLWKRFLLFGVICFPLGLWWPVRCKVLYGMPLGYVPSMSTVDNPQYFGNRGFWDRLFGMENFYLSNPYPNIGLTTAEGLEPLTKNDGYYDYSIAPYAVKSSLFGEYFNKLGVTSFQTVLSYIMIISALVLIAYSLVGMVRVFLVSYRTDRNGYLKANRYLESGEEQPFRFTVFFYGALIGSYVLFCIRYPFTCTMDFRYIVPALLLGTLFSGVFLKGAGKLTRALRIVYIGASGIFCLSSALFYYLSFNFQI